MRPHVIHWLERILPGGVASALAPSWFTCVGLAGVACLLVMIAIGRRHHIERRVIASIVLWCYVAAVTAGIVVPMAIDSIEQYFATGQWIVRWSGMTSFWGYLAGIAAVAVVCRAHRVPLARLLDLAAAPIGMALCFARLGCFLAGCDYGKVTSLPWAVRFPAGSPAWLDHLQSGLLPPDRAESLPVHPTQLYEALLGLVMVALGLVATRRRWVHEREGRVFLVVAAAYAIGRLAIEAVRGDAGRGVYLGLSSGQIFSIVVLVAIGAALVATRRAAALAIAAAALALVVGEPRVASAQPAPIAPAAQRAPTAPTAQPAPPAVAPAPAPAVVQQPSVVAPMQAPVASASTPSNALELGLLLGVAVPFNRRPDQVPTMTGASLSIGYGIGRAGVWFDFDSYANTDATHRTALLSGSWMSGLGKLRLGARAGAGATLVTFKDPVFAGATGSVIRIEAVAEYLIARSWTLWARPFTFDVMSASMLGGPIATYQMRIGIAYRFDMGERSRAAQPATPAPPQPAPPPVSPPPPNAPPPTAVPPARAP